MSTTPSLDTRHTPVRTGSSPVRRSRPAGALRGAAVALAAGLAVAGAPAAGAQSLSLTLPTIQLPTIELPTTPAQTDPELAQIVEEIYAETNRERMAAGAAPVDRNLGLERIAQDWSDQMAAEASMYHNPDLRAEMTAFFGSSWRLYGENVLQNWATADGEDLVRQWMASPGHRANLLNPKHTDLGVGVAVAPSGKLYATQDFAVLNN